MTQRFFSQAGQVVCRGGAHEGCGHSCDVGQVLAWASSAAASFFVTARGLQSIAQQAPGASLVNVQSSSLAQEASSASA